MLATATSLPGMNYKITDAQKAETKIMAIGAILCFFLEKNESKKSCAAIMSIVNRRRSSK